MLHDLNVIELHRYSTPFSALIIQAHIGAERFRGHGINFEGYRRFAPIALGSLVSHKMTTCPEFGFCAKTTELARD
jgi:hypothetical protein